MEQIHRPVRLMVEGGRRLDGAVTVHGAKNSVLPILAAALLAKTGPDGSGGVSEIENCPELSDVRVACDILRHLGCTVTVQGDLIRVEAGGLCRSDIPDDLMSGMRSSIVFLGAVIARAGEARMTYPGGCDLGPRPIDLHLSSLERLGVEISERHGVYHCRAPKRLRGATVILPIPSVGATENILLAAVTAEGVTVIRNAAREPEVADLCRYLIACGADIRGVGEGVLEIHGVETLYGAKHRVIPDRIEAATYMAAAAVTGGTLTLKQVEPEHLAPVLPLFEEVGCRIAAGTGELRISAPPRLRRIRAVRTMPYPGFPTDAAAPMMAMACVADGTSLFIENIFQNRYNYVSHLTKMGARVKVEGQIAVAEGVPQLFGAKVACTDLRGGAALVVAALAAQGVSEISELAHLDRGYQDLVGCLTGVGAEAKRIHNA